MCTKDTSLKDHPLPQGISSQSQWWCAFCSGGLQQDRIWKDCVNHSRSSQCTLWKMISQLKREDFLLPEVSLSDSGAAEHVALIYKGGRAVGWIEGREEGKAEIHSLLGDCFWSLVQVPCCWRPLSSCCDAVWDAAQILRQRNTQAHSNPFLPPPTPLSLCLTHTLLCTQKHTGKFKLFPPLSKPLHFSLSSSASWGICMCCCLLTRLPDGRWSVILQCSSVHSDPTQMLPHCK